jgi:hypothetical protein
VKPFLSTLVRFPARTHVSNHKPRGMVKVNGEQPLSQRYRDLVRVLVSILVRLVCYAGSATAVARKAHSLGTIIDCSMGLVG